MTDTSSLEGHRAIEAALTASSRTIHTLYIHHKKQYDRQLASLRRKASDAGIRVEYVPDDIIEQHTSGNTHGGAVALVGPRQFLPLDSLLQGKGAACIVMLDGVEDPFNFGYAVRSLYAAGVHGLVVRPRNWTTAAAVVGRASAGTSELMPMGVADTAEDAADFYKSHGLTIAVTAKAADSISLYDANLTQPLFMLIGGEKRGVTRSFMDRAELLLEIPYGRGFDGSLGTVGASSVLAFEIMRQRTSFQSRRG